ncbi:MAG: hypothetical protein QOF90_3299, partial [Acetobacteraceae bacterium]|nr:hypothetical protein [Acetobacteraceae bacterium]
GKSNDTGHPNVERMLAQGGQCYMMGGNSTVYYMHPPWQFF